MHLRKESPSSSHSFSTDHPQLDPHLRSSSSSSASSASIQSSPSISSSRASSFSPFTIHSIIESNLKPPPPVCETDQAATATATPTSPNPSTSPTSDPNSHPQSSAERRRKEKTSWSYVLRSGLAGGIAGCAAKTAIAPLDRVKILFQAQNPEFRKYSGRWLGVFTAASDIIKTQGPFALFQGHSATLLRIFPYAAIKYMAYDKLHFLLMPTHDMETSSRLFLAGASSGVLSVFLTYPLELIRVRLAFETKRKRQSGSLLRIIKTIYTEGATEAPFSGDARRRAGRLASTTPASTTATTTTTTTATSSTLKTNAASNPTPNPNPATIPKSSPLLTSAIQSQAIAQGATISSPIPINPNPSNVTIQTNKLLEKLPILKFYRGFSVTVMGMIPYAGTSFLVFGRMKTWLQNLIPSKEEMKYQPLGFLASKTSIDLISGALAGAISQTTAYPFEVVRRRQQVGGIIRPNQMLGMAETTLWIWKTSGWRGFYVGLSIGFLKVVPMTSISFAVWLSMKRQMGI